VVLLISVFYIRIYGNEQLNAGRRITFRRHQIIGVVVVDMELKRKEVTGSPIVNAKTIEKIKTNQS
jgi:hypothetical protein